MIDKIREYENRYWLLNDDVYELHFTQFYDEEFAESVEDAMEQFEDMVIDYIKEKIAYFDEMLDKFQEEK